MVHGVNNESYTIIYVFKSKSLQLKIKAKNLGQSDQWYEKDYIILS